MMANEPDVFASVSPFHQGTGIKVMMLHSDGSWHYVTMSSFHARLLGQNILSLCDAVDDLSVPAVKEPETPPPLPQPTPGDVQDMRLAVEQGDWEPVRFEPDAEGYENGD